jgi:hypothetical protein
MAETFVVWFDTLMVPPFSSFTSFLSSVLLLLLLAASLFLFRFGSYYYCCYYYERLFTNAAYMITELYFRPRLWMRQR